MFRTLLVASLALGASAHLFISSPQPIPETAVKPPLEESGSDFPCHKVSLPTSGGQKMAAGSKQLLAFDLGGGANTAVHGGGSCQLSITYETDPAKLKQPSSWKVIHSILGGCPTDAAGNLGTSIPCNETAGVECVNSFDFTMPKGVKNGHAIMAWTWFNTIGNREMYMNCANTQITGGDGSEMNSFPDLFVANLDGINQCKTTESTFVKFPNPGKYVTTKTEGSQYKLAPPSGECGSSSGGSGTGGNQAPAPQPPAQQSAPAPAPTSQATTPSAAPQPSQAPAPSPDTASPGACTDGAVKCSKPSQLVCIDSTHFGICDTDLCAVPMAVAPGTTCSNGKISKRGRRSLESHKRRNRH